MQIYFKTRQAARASTIQGKIVDNGTESPQGKRWGKEPISLSKRKAKGA